MPPFKDIYRIIKNSLKDFNDHFPIQLASSTAFFCLFALPPILVILMTLLGAFIKPEDLSGDIFQFISSTLGERGADQLEEIIQNFREYADDTFTTVLVAIFLIIIATNLFLLLRKSINQLWEIKVKRSPGLLVLLKSRLTALILLFAGGVIILLSLFADAAVAFVGDNLQFLLPNIDLPAVGIINTVFSIIIITVWFSLLFKILPNAIIEWKPALVGGFATSLLFTIGKFIIGLALVRSDIGNIYGAAGSIILILLFLFYSFLIFYFGATLTKHYGDYIEMPIKADKYSEKSDDYV